MRNVPQIVPGMGASEPWELRWQSCLAEKETEGQCVWELSVAGVNPKQRWTQRTRDQASTAVAAVALSPILLMRTLNVEVFITYPVTQLLNADWDSKLGSPAVQNTHSNRA